MSSTQTPAAALAVLQPGTGSERMKNNGVMRPRTSSGLASPNPTVSRRRDGNGSMRAIRVLLVDDHPIVRKGLASCLARHSHLLVVGEAADGMEALDQARTLLPDVILLDIDLPKLNGLGVAEALRKELPKIKVLILSMYQQPESLPRIFQSGARGYLLKDALPDELVKAIETVADGESCFSPEIARAALNQLVQGKKKVEDLSGLTNREREVLVLIAAGLSNKEIATNLNVGVRTVETHRERTMRKLNIHSVAGLTRFAIAKGLVRLQDAAWR